MVKLDVTLLRFMEDEDFRVLTALEMAMRNHDVAPTALVERIAQLPHGGCRKRLSNLLKHKMIHHENTMYDGYAMKYGAYDYLALRTLSKRGTCAGVGHRIGCGKESDIILVRDEAGHDCVLKLQRLGRCSFRTVTRNRDYKGNGRTRHGESWFYLSRLASQKEYSFMKVLYDEGFPVPKPIDQNRHALLMELVPGTLLNNITELGDASKVYRRALELMVRLAEVGLIHGDFNEFNLMITDDQRVVVIDFPQMISTNHPNASELFDRDVHNLANFFHRRFKVDTTWFPSLETDVVRKGELDKQVYASGHFTRRQQEDLERLMEEGFERAANGDGDEADSASDDSDGDSHTAASATPTDTVRPSVPDTFTGIPRGTDAGRSNSDGDGEEGEDGEDDESDGGSLEEAMDDARELRQGEFMSRNATRNANFLPGGEINEDHVKHQIRKGIRRKDNSDFNRHLHRNVQKGRQKQKIQRQLKSSNGGGFFD
ncbi:Rio2, N-terminal/RIO1 family/Phosphotransferase enzyme family [Novymonas esmeraldas]|uniref:Serine/threonine-protein kinase RIO2 n=1 Tax=Novymonas esmeraldas TaxID=1808958 RepID=A0AAW0EJK0_9TRYP